MLDGGWGEGRHLSGHLLLPGPFLKGRPTLLANQGGLRGQRGAAVGSLVPTWGSPEAQSC